MRKLPFPVAAHTYFKVTNQAIERERFLADPTYEPVFSYSKHMDEQLVGERLAKTPDPSSAKRSLALVQASLNLQETHSEANLILFRELNEALFGAPSKEYATGLLVRIHKLVTEETKKHWEHISSVLQGDFIEMPDIVPSPEDFVLYKSFFSRYTGGVEAADMPLAELLRSDLQKTGLSRDGWHVALRDDDSHAHVHHHAKTVSVGIRYVPRTHRAAVRIATHEVYGHALRGYQDSVAESEGFAILLEQLLDDRFKFRRSYRYLAAALGWGVLSAPLSFRQVYEIIWRAMVIVGTYPLEKARIYAFDECTRVFRGGVPAVPGAVYLKDGVYFEANVQMWQRLKEQPLSYDEFVDVIEGRRRILS